MFRAIAGSDLAIRCCDRLRVHCYRDYLKAARVLNVNRPTVFCGKTLKPHHLHLLSLSLSLSHSHVPEGCRFQRGPRSSRIHVYRSQPRPASWKIPAGPKDPASVRDLVADASIGYWQRWFSQTHTPPTLASAYTRRRASYGCDVPIAEQGL
jgi:hypothetical protein